MTAVVPECDIHTVDVGQACTTLGTSQIGLTTAEARRRLQTDGPNAIPKPRKMPLILRLPINICFSGFAPLLWCAAGLAFAIYPPPLSNPPNLANLYEAIALILVNVISGCLAFWQEFQADRTLEAFAKRLASSATVIRDGLLVQVPAVDLVYGDMIELRTGDKVAADIRIIQSTALGLNNAVLTGEGVPVAASVGAATSFAYPDAPNMAWMGTTVEAGSGRGIVVHTGPRTRMGKIMKLTNEAKEGRTILENELLRFVIIIAVIALSTDALCVIVWAAWLRTAHSTYLSVPALLNNVVGFPVAYIPEGLPISVTLTLLIIVRHLNRRYNVLTKRLPIVETMGCINCLLSDKTGTLTTGIMTLKAVIAVDRDGAGPATPKMLEADEMVVGTPYSQRLLRALALCNAAELSADGTVVNGNPSDTAILRFVEQLSPGSVAQYRKASPQLAQIPFSSTTKVMVTVNRIDGRSVVILKGAYEAVLEARCTKGSALLPNMQETPLHAAMLEALDAEARRLGAMSYRVLAIADLALDPVTYPPEFVWDPSAPNFPTESMTLLGLIALVDPPRSDVPDTIAVLRRAGVRVAMVTGDHPATAEAIARMIGLITKPTGVADGARVVRGIELEDLTKEDWDALADTDELVFARTTPEHKMMVVKNFQERGKVVAVTGDGVNDAPALKLAHVGIAMGKSGTEVAKEAAKVILVEDSFAAIPKAVEYGRLGFVNLKKVCIYLLPAGTFAEMLTVVANLFFGVPQALGSSQMITVSMLTDVFASIAIVLEPPEPDMMLQPPRSLKKDRLVNAKLICHAYFFLGILDAIAAFGNYFWFMTSRGYPMSDLVFAWGWGNDGFAGKSAATQASDLASAQSVYFITLVVCQLGNLLGTRRRRLPYFYTPKVKQESKVVEVKVDSGEAALAAQSAAEEARQQRRESLHAVLRVAVCAIASATVAVVYTEVPAVANALTAGPAPAKHWGLAFAASAFIFGMNELRKWLIVFFPNGPIARVAW